jgi:hypothetical protein
MRDETNATRRKHSFHEEDANGGKSVASDMNTNALGQRTMPLSNEPFQRRDPKR